MKRAVLTASFLILTSATQAQSPVPVTVDNFGRAESDLYFGNGVKDAGGIGKLFHHREPMAIDKQGVIRSNRDTLYSMVVVDLDAGPVTIKLPDAGKRFRSLMVVNEDHYIVGDIEYRAGSYTYDRKRVGTRYALIGDSHPRRSRPIPRIRAGSRAAGRRSRSARKAPGKFEVPNWDPVSQKKVREALLVLASTAGGFKRSFGAKGQVDPVRHLIGDRRGLGRQSRQGRDVSQRHARARTTAATVYRLTVKDVPVDGFWSISVYNAEGYFQKNPSTLTRSTIMTAKKNSRRLLDGPVRRLRRQDRELPADREGLELRAALSAAPRDPERHVEVPRAAAGELKAEGEWRQS